MLTRFVSFARSRPFVGGVLTSLAGIEIFFSGQLDLGNIRVSVGIEGLQATILPAMLVLLGILSITDRAHRIFYGVIALAISVYSLVGVNLGGFFVGMLLGSIGGILIVSWMPKTQTTKTQETDATEVDSAEASPLASSRV